jgi:FlaA1/EpsC-like NDP-sugar epimerase
MFKTNSKIKHLGLAIIDAVLVITALSVSVYLRFEWNVPDYIIDRLTSLILPAVIISLAAFFLFGFYRRIWRYAGVDDFFLIAVAVSIAILGTYVYSLYSGFLGFASYIIAWFLMLFFIGGSRLAVRLLSAYLSRRPSGGISKNALIVGAGEGGVLVARELKKHGPSLEMNVIGFIDDDPAKQRQIIQGIPVLGTRSVLTEVVEQKQIDEVVIAMPSAPYSVLQEIIGLCEDLKVKIKTVPGIFEILEGQVNFSSLKEVDIEDLLRRPPVKQDLLGVAAYLTGRIVLVTGAGGSIGSELCRQIAQLGPDKLILLDHDENGIYYIHVELVQRFSRVNYAPLVCDIKDRTAVEQIFREHRPEVVFHAAAHKHVPLMEINREEAVKNNIEGSRNLIDLAAENGVKRFVFISTDKAVNPSSVMGATKRVVEIYLQDKARNCKSCVFCSVRFGNVLGSQGSVVLLFREQIARGGPVTVTDPEMKRYFMTIPEAVQLVIQAGALGKGGEIFVLDMGEPIRIIDLARDMIILSGLKPERDIKIEFTGLRPGEKLYEELFSDRENFTVTRHERIYIAPDTAFDNEDIKKELVKLGARLSLGNNLLDIIDLSPPLRTFPLHEKATDG